MNVLVSIKLSNSKSGEYSYQVSAEQYHQLSIGSQVVVNVNNQLKIGTVINKSKQSNFEYELKPIVTIYNPVPLNRYQSIVAREIYENSISSMIAVQNLFIENLSNNKVNIEYFEGDKLIADFKSSKNKKQLLASDYQQRVVIDCNQPIKTYKYVSNNPHYDQKLTYKQQIVVDYLENKGTVSISKLIDETGVSRAVINTLIKNHGLEVTNKSKQFDTLYELEWHQVNHLSIEQQFAVDSFKPGLNLLYGVSASGKTEVYIELIKRTIASGKQALIVVPSVMLAIQVVGRLQRLFDDVIVYHNKLTQGERLSFQQQIKNNQKNVVISTFNGLFLPFENLKLVVFDEAHSTNYCIKKTINVNKQVIIDGLLKQGINVLLGTATPLVIDYALTEYHKANLFVLSNRYGQSNFPDITFTKPQDSVISTDLIDLVKINRLRKQPTMIFYNKSGYARQVLCEDCYHLHICSNCGKPLSYSQSKNELSCKYDGYKQKYSHKCSKCNSSNLKLIGIGIEKFYDQLVALFPELIIKVVDNTLSSEQLYQVMTDFGNGDIDVLIGTQIIAFGIDFLNVDSIYIANIDNLLTLNEINSHEQTYNILEQVAGRVGRNQKFSRAIIETNFEHHFVMQAIASHDFHSYYKQEMEYRKSSQNSPYYRTVKVELQALNERKLENIGNQFIRELKTEGLELSQLQTPYVEYRFNKYRRYFLIKYRHQPVRKIIKEKLKLLQINNIDYNIDLNITEIGV